MTTATQSILFSYHDAQQFPQSAELQHILGIISYRVMVGEPQRRCSKGRDAFPVEAMLRLTVLKQESAASLLRELHRDPAQVSALTVN